MLDLEAAAGSEAPGQVQGLAADRWHDQGGIGVVDLQTL
jgi:hypothetical protein